MCWHFIKDSGRLFMVVVAGWVEHVVVVPPTVIPFIYVSYKLCREFEESEVSCQTMFGLGPVGKVKRIFT